MHADPAAVDHPHLTESMAGRGGHVLLDDRRNVTRRERMQVEGILERKVDGLLVGIGQRRGPAMTCCCQ